MRLQFAVALATLATCATPPAQAQVDDRSLCFSDRPSTAEAVSACTRLIEAGAGADVYLWRGIHHFKLQQYDPALADFNLAIAANPENQNAYHHRGIILRMKGDLAGSLRDHDQSIRIIPNGAMSFLERGRTKSAQKDVDGAISDFSEAIRLDPANKLFYFFRGSTRAQAFRGFQEALADFDETLARDPAYRGAAERRPELARDPVYLGTLEGRAYVLVMLGRYDDAIAAANRFIEVVPRYSQGFNYRGIARQGKQSFAEALSDLDEAVRLAAALPAPIRATYLVNRGNIRRELGDIDKAVSDYDAALALSNLALAHSNRGLAWRAAGELDKAIRDFDRALTLDPDYADAYVNRGFAFEGKGEIAKAKADFQSALDKPDKYLFTLRYKQAARARLIVLQTGDAAPPATSRPGSSERRVALVIGNGKYRHAAALPNPANDARLISKSLRDMGFDVTDGLDLNKDAMKKTINAFLGKAATAKIAVVFYAGHGMQVNGKNYLVPTDFDTSKARDAEAAMVEVDFILAGLDDQIRTNIIILDACRNNPLVDEKKPVVVAGRSISVRSGLATPSGLGAGAALGAGTLLAFATAPGQVALDGDGTNSPFSAALGRHISTPGIEVQQMLTRVRAEVVSATKNQQVPWSNSSLLGDVFLVGAR